MHNRVARLILVCVKIKLNTNNYKYMQYQRGFTIIELIVVIAIIAVLATIVTASVTTYIDKSRNASIKANMGNLLTYGVMYFSDHEGTYDSFCTDAAGKVQSIKAAIDAITSPDLAVCNCDTVGCASAAAWCMVSQLKGTVLVTSGTPHPPKYCVDSKGTKIETTDYQHLVCTSGACVLTD